MCAALNLPDILLLISEHADLPSLAALMCTSKHIRHVILSYEISISATRLRTLPVTPTGSVLSTRDAYRRDVLPRFSFSTARELQRRRQRILAVVESEFLAANHTIPASGKPQYLARLERAAHMCDHISDLGCSCGDGAPEPGREVREAQASFIGALAVDDLAFLWELAWMGSIGWARSRGTTVESDPDTWYKSLAFEELVLRQGSLFLWGYGLGHGRFRENADKQVLRGASEIREWELGLCNRLPSLRQAVIRTFMARKGCHFRDVFREMAGVVSCHRRG